MQDVEEFQTTDLSIFKQLNALDWRLLINKAIDFIMKFNKKLNHVQVLIICYYINYLLFMCRSNSLLFLLNEFIYIN